MESLQKIIAAADIESLQEILAAAAEMKSSQELTPALAASTVQCMTCQQKPSNYHLLGSAANGEEEEAVFYCQQCHMIMWTHLSNRCSIIRKMEPEIPKSEDIVTHVELGLICVSSQITQSISFVNLDTGMEELVHSGTGLMRSSKYAPQMLAATTPYHNLRATVELDSIVITYDCGGRTARTLSKFFDRKTGNLTVILPKAMKYAKMGEVISPFTRRVTAGYSTAPPPNNYYSSQRYLPYGTSCNSSDGWRKYQQQQQPSGNGMGYNTARGYERNSLRTFQRPRYNGRRQDNMFQPPPPQWCGLPDMSQPPPQQWNQREAYYQNGNRHV